MKKRSPHKSAHLRLVTKTSTPLDRPGHPKGRSAEASAELPPCDQALVTLAVAVATRQPQYFDTQLRLLEACGLTRARLAELMTLTVQINGPEVMISAAEVMDRYDTMCPPR